MTADLATRLRALAPANSNGAEWALMDEAAAAINAGVCADCHSDTWNPGEGWLVRKNGMVTVCRSAWHPENERNLPPVARLPRSQDQHSGGQRLTVFLVGPRRHRDLLRAVRSENARTGKQEG